MSNYKQGLENLNEEYKNYMDSIQEFINKQNTVIERLISNKERLTNERNSIPQDNPDREKIVESYNNDIDKIDNELENILAPSKENYSNTIDEIFKFKKEIENIKKDIHDLINEIENENSKLKYDIRGWSVDNKTLNHEYYEISNIILENNNIITSLYSIIEQYDKLKEDLKNYENGIYEPNKFAEIIKNKKEVETKKEIIKPEEELVSEEEIINDKEFKEALEEYEELQVLYNEALESLYVLQEKYENGEIDYSEYKKQADYMVDRYNYMLVTYNNLKKLFDKINNNVENLTNEELENQLKKLKKESDEIWNQQVQVENGEIPDNSLEEINKKIKLLENELQLRKESTLRGLTIEELQNKKDELYKKIAEQQNADKYDFKTHLENGIEGYEKDDIDNELRIINEEIKRRNNNKNKMPGKPIEPTMVLEKKQEPPVPEPIPEPTPEPIPEPVQEQTNKYTLEGIIQKIVGEESISSRQSKNYMVSQIKVYNKLPKNNWANPYKIVSIPRKIGALIMIPFNGLKKLIGKIGTTKETKESVEKMQKRIDELTDEEIEIFLKEYKGSTALGFRMPKLFNEMIRARIIKYITPKINNINSRIAELLAQIEFHKKIADGIELKINDPKLSDEEKDKLNNLHRQAYTKCAQEIREMNNLKKEGNELQSGNGLHAVEEELNATNSKMNYKGGRFAKNGEINSDLWKVLGQTKDAIELSNNPYAIVDAYFKQKETYIRNTEEKRTISSLGSKVTSGKLDYRPFVENLYYGNDMFISDLISSIILTTSAITLANTLLTNAKNATALNGVNEKISELEQTVKSGENTLEDGMLHDIRRNYIDSENLAERGNLDANDWALNSQAYKTGDLAHHQETANFANYSESQIADLTSKYDAGTLTYPEYIRGLEKIKIDGNNFYENLITKNQPIMEEYARTHPNFDLTSILTGLKGVANSQGSSAAMTDYLLNVYEQAYKLIDFNNPELISQTIASTSIIPPIITTAAAANKVVSEDIKVKKSANSTEWDKEGKFAELLEFIKKGELVNQDKVDKAIEESIQTGKML